jgi:ribosomal protein S20
MNTTLACVQSSALPLRQFVKQLKLATRMLQATIDKIADKKIAHKNTASRQKSRLSAAIKAMAA